MKEKLERKWNDFNVGHAEFEILMRLEVSSHAPTQKPLQV